MKNDFEANKVMVLVVWSVSTVLVGMMIIPVVMIIKRICNW